MSEYQYYEFRAIDRPLTRKQMAELRDFSSRARITSTSFVNDYQWGDFKGDPNLWMEQYFDAFMYFANWGTRHLMLRIPAPVLPQEKLESYCAGESLSFWTKGEHHILSFLSEIEDYAEEEGNDELSALTPLRADLTRGDYRCLYLGWLLAVQNGGVDEDDLEPPVPPGLKKLNSALQDLADFFYIDGDLIAAAAETSADGQVSGVSHEKITSQLAKLSAAEKDGFLIRLIESDEPHLVSEWKQRFLCEIRDESTDSASLRTVAELLERAELLRKAREH